MPIIAVASAKGGTGKTTAALSLAAALAEIPAHAISVVLIDLDPGADATRRMGVERGRASLGALMEGRRNAFDHVGDFTVLQAGLHTGEGFAIVPSGEDVDELEARFAKLPGGTELLVYRLHALGRECHLVIDTAPGIKSLLGRAAIAAADVLIVPVLPQPGASRHVMDIVGILRGMGGHAHVLIVAAHANGTGIDIKSLNDDLRADDLAISEWFPYEVEMANAAWSTGTPLLHAPSSRCVACYRNLAQHIVHSTASKLTA